MSTAYTVVTISEDVAKWLQDRRLALPSDWQQSRYPSPAEIRLALEHMPEYRADYRITDRSWSVTVSEAADPETGRWASLVVLSYSGDQSAVHKFYFETGWREVMVDILRALAKYCGPLVLINHSDTSDVLVAA